MGFFEFMAKELLGVGSTRTGNRDYNFTRNHRHKTDTLNLRVAGVRIHEVSGTCNSCDGSGHMNWTCGGCKGSGKFRGKCRGCQGSGIFTFTSGRTAPCRRCDGTGDFSSVCRRCDGSGRYEPCCHKCGGSGQHYRRSYGSD